MHTTSQMLHLQEKFVPSHTRAFLFDGGDMLVDKLAEPTDIHLVLQGMFVHCNSPRHQSGEGLTLNLKGYCKLSGLRTQHGGVHVVPCILLNTYIIYD